MSFVFLGGIVLDLVAVIWVLGQEEETGAVLPHWVRELVAAVLAMGMLALLVYWLRPTKGGVGFADFTIVVEGGEVRFKGKFPAAMEGMVEDFLLNDCRVEGNYEVRGRWEEGRLVVSVSGKAAMGVEQRIRNFLKLNVKRAV